MPVRSPAVAGRFYPADPGELEREIGACLAAGTGLKEAAVGVVVPHAGYVYSGSIAGATFSRVLPPDRAIVLGPNHTGRGARRALFETGSWDLPGGGLRIDSELANRLRDLAALEPDTEAHRFEHSIEVELPFLRALRRDMAVVPICLARLTLAECRDLGKNVARAVERGGGQTLLVASTDMSHYLAADDARELDQRAIERVQNLDPEGLYRVVTDLDISMCGFVPTTVSLFAARALGATRATLVRYGHSGERTGDFTRVVGYAGFVLS
jgi:AmmeMemoRadiSam system protein B